MKYIIVACLLAAVLCQSTTTFANLASQSKNWDWQPNQPSKTVISSRPSSPFSPPPSDNIGGGGEFTIEPGSSAESAILSLLKSSTNSKDAESFQTEKNKKPSDSELSSLRASAPASVKAQASSAALSAKGGASASMIARRPGQPYPGYPPYYPPDDYYFYPPVTRRLVCRVTYNPWKMCCYYTSWWWGAWGGPEPYDPQPEPYPYPYPYPQPRPYPYPWKGPPVIVN